MSPDPKVEPAPELVVEAQKLLDAAGVRMFTIEGEITIGIWSDTDAPVLRHALRVMGLQGYPIRHLEGRDIPLRYKLRKCPVREDGQSWVAWKAAALNKLFGPES